MRSLKMTLVLLVVVMLASCGVAVPAEKAAYVGEWKADGMSLLITRDGSIVYHRMRKGARTSIDAPLKSFHGDDFDVGIGPMTTTFKVNVPPHESGGEWKMTVDGVELTRSH
ncbi:hypothetical protein [Dokdonella immobilis]|uniref:Uncharacterized protein n=1 Tax=Dokdonella immobilis TaxID=578942 RepID=A0A1I5B6S4_9GAMM|nr:hypothetical protein [Dokdonella immobilis]SFN70403.1 hypothetical protein SAMN05216289_1538 [Dokdonella immobilis]